MQLLDNAVKFSSPEQPVSMGAQRDESDILLWVQDYGRGIEPSEQARIWQSFYQIDRATYEDQGTGSGLAIVHGIVRLHGGQTELESQPQQGSRFTLRIPLT